MAHTTWYVDGANGNDGNDCKTRQTACKTIGHAISLASSGDTIGIGPATYTENLTISISLKVIGSGAATTIIDGGGVATAVTISSGTVSLSGMTIRRGHSSPFGGGIQNYGTLTLGWSTISDNSVGGTGGFGSGGGLFNGGTLTINNSTITGNTVIKPRCKLPCRFYGNGIYNGGTLNINNSTVTGNNGAGFPGGAIYSSATVKINNTTVSGNTGGGGIVGDGTATIENSIVANNSPSNCFSGTVTSNGYNLSSDNTCNFNGPGDLNNTNPLLGTFGNYGGPTQTVPLLSGSPAIDTGNPNGCTDGSGHLLKTDQRGQPRPDKEDTGGCDMGAFERQSD